MNGLATPSLRGEGGVGVDADGEGNDDLIPLRSLLQGFPDMLGCFGDDGFSTPFAVELSDAGKKKLHIIRQFRHGSDSRSGGSDRIFPINGDGRGNIFNAVDLRAVHAFHELTRVRRKGLHVSPLAFGIKRVEGKGGLSRAAQTGYDGDLVQRDIKVKVLKVMLSGTSYPDGPSRGVVLVHKRILLKPARI